jgi:hypothetical protein
MEMSLVWPSICVGGTEEKVRKHNYDSQYK